MHLRLFASSIASLRPRPDGRRLTRLPVCISLLLLAFFLPQIALALAPEPNRRFQDFVQDTWSLEEGLPQITVTAIAQDAEGYLWVGTQQGLSRFDGVRFLDFGRGQPNDLPGAFIQALRLDAAGRLWIGTYKGVSLYQDRGFSSVGLAAVESGAEITVRDFAPLSDRSMLVAADEGLFRSQGEFLEPVILPHAGPVGALLASEQGVWVGSLGRYWLFDGERFVRTRQLPAGMEAVLINDLALHAGDLWLASSAGLFRDAGQAPVPVDLPEPVQDTPVDVLFRDSSDTLWAGTAQGLLRFHQGDLLELIDNDHPRSHRQVQSVFEDREGNLWMGGFLDGLARFWSGWAEHYNEPQGLHEPLVWSVAQAADGQSLWVGTNDGLSRLEDGRFQRWLSGSELPHPHAYTLHAESEGLWIGTRRGLLSVDVRDRRLSRPDVLRVLDPYQVNGIVPAGEHGRFFILSSNGLYLWDGDGQLDHLQQGIGTRMVRQLHLQADGQIVVATDSGAFFGRPDQLKRFDQAHGVDPAADFSAIHRLDGRWLLLSTIDRGLYIGNGDRFRALGTQQGLPSPTSYFLDDDGTYLWVAGFQGVYRVALTQLLAFAEGRVDALDAQMILSESGTHAGSQQALCCNGAGHAKGLMREDGLWLPTRGGLARLQSQLIRPNPVPPEVLVERLRFDGRWQAVSPGQHIELPLGERDVNIEFTALSFQDPRSVRLRYRLAGYDQDWHGPTSLRSTSYTNLPPGDYRFEVMAANNAGVWNQQPAVLVLSVPARFHETLWFWLLPLSGLLLLFALGYQWRRRQWQKREAWLEAKVMDRTADLQAAREHAEHALEQLQSTQGELIAAEKMASVGRLVTGMAHEINTPLGNSLTLSSSLAERAEQLERVVLGGEPLARSRLTGYLADNREALALMLSNLKRATQLMRSFKRLAGEATSTGGSTIKLAELLDSVELDNRARVKRQSVTLDCHCPASLTLHCERDSLIECLNQLIDNSLAHGFDTDRAEPLGSRVIVIEARQQAGDVVIEYRDTGKGIDETTREHIFEPFYASMRKTDHAGVGMHMVFNLVTRVLGGRLECLPAETGAHFRIVVAGA